MSDDVILQRQGANYFGFERVDPRTGKVKRETSVVRGNGTFTLTKESATFERWEPPVEIVIPLEMVTAVELKKSHNGKSFGFLPVLRLTFTDPTGETSILGVCVGRQAESEEWMNTIGALIGAMPAQ